MAEPRTLMFVSHTHWDREWYEPFEIFRMKLVRLVDRLLDILETNPAYRHFMLDGQTIVLDDYLAVRPENEGRLRALIEAGRIQIGPWHILPDEFLVSPEATIRNLLVGRATAARFGDIMPLGNIPDPFGHISQMPQIMRGFGMDTMAFWRGVAGPPNEFTWRGPDGSRVLVLFQRHGYMNATDMPADKDAFIARTRRIIEALADTASSPYLLAMNGSDHVEPMAALPDLLAQADAALPDVNLVHGTLPMFREALLASHPELTVVEGELRSGQTAPLLPGVLSARIWIKQRNVACENLLTRWAEPFTALAEMCGAEGVTTHQAGLVRAAWRTLLENHPHDSICGCSIDQVHKEMEPRFDRVDQLGEALAQSNLNGLANRVDTSSAEELAVVVYNAATRVQTGLVEAMVPLPDHAAGLSLVADGVETPATILRVEQEPVWDGPVPGGIAEMVMGMISGGWRGTHLQELSLDEGGETPHIEAQVGVAPPNEPKAIAAAQAAIRDMLASEPAAVSIHAMREPMALARFAAQDVPGMGYKTFAVNPLPEATAATTTVGRVIENGILRVALADDATVSVADLRSGREWRGLNRFADDGDCGDTYNHCPVRNGDTYDEAELLDSSVRTEPDGRQTLTYRLRLSVPASLGSGRDRRAHEMVDLPLTVAVSLAPGVPRADVRVNMVNEARDHRLRVLFPMSGGIEAFETEGHYDVITRPLDLAEDTAGWIEQPIGTHPQRRWSRLGGADGLLVGNRGLPEVEAVPTPDGAALALTLLRAVGWLSRDDLWIRPAHVGPVVATPMAQCIGPHAFDYCLAPATGGEVSLAEAFGLPLRAALTTRHSGDLPAKGAFVSLSGEGLLLSACKMAEDGSGLLVRFWNRTDTPVNAQVRFWRTPTAAWRCRMDETEREPISLDDDGTVCVTAAPRQVVTVLAQIE